MKITNKLGLPTQLVRAVESDYKYKDKKYSITSLLDPSRVLQLKRRHNDEIEQDVSESIWMAFGTGFHSVFENIKLHDYELAEQYVRATVYEDYILSGIVDYINTKDKYVVDYKTTSVWSVIYESNNDKWLKQLQMSAYLWYKETNEWYDKGYIYAFLKDFNKRDSKSKDNYPELPIKVIEFDLGTVEEIEEWIINKFKDIKVYESLLDNQLPMCTLEDRFNKGDTFAIKKKKTKRAMKVHTDYNEAKKHLSNLERKYPNMYELDIRKGKDVKCLDYCNCNKFCNYWREKYGNE